MRINKVVKKRIFVQRHDDGQVDVHGVHFEPGYHPIEHRVEYKADFPDIDLDFLPEAREKIKAYIAETYGKECVCNVGTHIGYQPMAALHDAARALGKGLKESEIVTKDLPLEFNSMDAETAKKEFPEIAKFADAFPDVFQMAYKMDGRIKTQGKHAGGVIISSVPLRDYMPLTMKDGQWTSAWTEGETAQLSRFGFVKFDLLGVTTLSYIYKCLQNIEQNKGVKIEWDIDPEVDQAGWEIFPDGRRERILFSDPVSMAVANSGKVDTVFQFDTDLAKSIISKGKITHFNDFVVYTALGRPGPLPMIDEYIKRRDGHSEWRENNKITDYLASTFNVPTFQEQLTEIWQGVAGMTGPEAQAALKVIRKKKVDQMEKVRKRWMEGAEKTLGHDVADAWWKKQETFGMYAFNKSHSVAYCNIAFRCLWLKAHYPTEWWAACLEYAGRDKIPLYMNASRRDGVKFRPYNANDLHAKFTVVGDEIIPGLHMIKGFGEKAAHDVDEKREARTTFGIGNREVETMPLLTTLDDFISYYDPGRTQIEALIKLGAFDSFVEGKNRKALWAWWQYKYGSNEEDRDVKRKILWALRWDPKKVAEHRMRLRDSYLSNPRRKVVPKKISEWVPDTVHNECAYKFDPKVKIDKDSLAYKECAKIKPTFQDVCKLFADGYSLKESLDIEMSYLDFYWTSPMCMFNHKGLTIEKAKKANKSVVVEGIIKRTIMLKTKKGDSYMKILISDGLEEAMVNIWGNQFERLDYNLITTGDGLRIPATWDEKYQSFTPEDVGLIVGLEKITNANQ